ncbi:MAG: tRNA uridine-5-carboxymethylaminomethyl(34) synthesis enzyme MnmG [Prevotellaceae bacterium]|jgi:tRNA uridine 5-carboxymethylaminomethyl modification enzyme|nr:tRNA uridine-5-carboxymethylaminomethyl(34) synthesis enzyme MnmG [Prevotellaceae bacterium]
MITSYDIIVVGGGHAGCEAAAAAANMGSTVLLVTMDMTKFASMSCNPAIGGIAKGQIVREIDALGGYSGIVTDRTSIQFRMLNRSKGPAMWSPRAQCDRFEFCMEWRKMLEAIPNLYFWQDSVTSLIIEDGKARGVETGMGAKFFSEAVILTSGTFMNGKIFVGRNQQSGGRMGDMASYGISEQLAAYSFEVGRMKTGTPARFDGRTIDFSKLTIQYGDENPSKFSFLPTISPVQNQKPCYVVNTSKKVHAILETGFDDSPLFTGTIKGIGPRYCPSIEDKIKTFAGKESHQLFLEPEGRDTNEYYLSGFSSSLPLEVQLTALREIEGFEKLEIFRPGYAIEYDYFPPTQLYHTLETKPIENLYFAGQVNGTTGYEEAGAQGLMAGVNAHLKLNQKEPFVLRRDQAYIGVLIDDLVTKGVDEPYRMFTSRAEYRILLRQDNADIRLTEFSYYLGLASQERYDLMKVKQQEVESLLAFIEKTSIAPSDVDIYLESIGSAPLRQQRKLKELLLRPEISIEAIAEIFPPLKSFLSTLTSPRAEPIEEANILTNYSGYIERERAQADKLSRLEKIKIPDTFNYSGLNITIEAQQKLSKICPRTIGQASRIPGVSPADISVLLISLGR